jgi:hypothetical protein
VAAIYETNEPDEAEQRDVEAEIRELKRRLSELEGSFQFLTTQVRPVYKDVLEFREDATRRFDQPGHDLQSFRDDLPGIVGGALREVLRPT